MKVLAVLGSPRKNGNTGNLLNHYLKGIEESNHNIEIENIFIQNRDIKSCVGCNRCQIKIGECVIKDDMEDVYSSVIQSEIIILSTPVYAFNMSSQLKTFLDRLHAIDYKIFKGKKIVLLTTYGDSEEKFSGVQNISNNIKMMAQMLEMDFVHTLNVSTFKVQVEQNIDALKKAYELGKKIIK
jgi:multimeric flavodoxin WrbA